MAIWLRHMGLSIHNTDSQNSKISELGFKTDNWRTLDTVDNDMTILGTTIDITYTKLKRETTLTYCYKKQHKTYHHPELQDDWKENTIQTTWNQQTSIQPHWRHAWGAPMGDTNSTMPQDILFFFIFAFTSICFYFFKLKLPSVKKKSFVYFLLFNQNELIFFEVGLQLTSSNIRNQRRSR